ncbi:MAG: c-type cytochrome [Burkholderiales bacterium]|nr:MAG: c-type cytochrome [Burkholderiales bacterium]
MTGMGARAVLAAALCAAAGWSSGALAADTGAVRYMAAVCANCHGTNGQSVGGNEALAGYDKAKFVQTMGEFKSGKRPATLMHQISKGFTDQQIAQLAEFFSGQAAK